MKIRRRKERYSFSKLKSVMEMPNLLAVQFDSFEHFLQSKVHPDERKDQGLQAVFKSIFPISDSNDNFSLEFVRYEIGEPKYSVRECQERDITYSAPLKVTLRLIIREPDKSGKKSKSKNTNDDEDIFMEDKHVTTVEEDRAIKNVIEQIVYFGELPMITDTGTFIINGAERVVVNQLHRSPGVFFDEEIRRKGKKLYSARIIPYRGSWVQFSMDMSNAMYVHINRRRKIPVTVLLRALGYESDEQLFDLLCSEDVMLRDYQSKRGDITELIGRVYAQDIVDMSTGEVLVQKGELFEVAHLEKLKKANIRKIVLRYHEDSIAHRILERTVRKEVKKDDAEVVKTQENALGKIYRLLRPGDPPNLETAKALLYRLFFSPKRYNLAKVGRYKINRRLGMEPVEKAYTIAKGDNEPLSISGKALNSDGKPVKGSQVCLTPVMDTEEGSKTFNVGSGITYTNKFGYYSFENVAPGKYELSINHPVYLNANARIELADHMALIVDFRLYPTVLTPRDFLEIVRYLLLLNMGKGFIDDIDHLGNRRARSVGELLSTQFNIGLTRMSRIIREGMTLHEVDKITPYDLINVRTVTSVVNRFFGSSQLSQFMDQTNPLAALTHKRRLSALGPGGLTRERATFDVRDVHYTHYGRMCPIETPEGQNIGLITSMSTFTKVNEYGFLETPYRKIVDGKVTHEIEYLSADQEDNFVIAGANAMLDEEGNFTEEENIARYRGEFNFYPPEEIQYMDVSPAQMVSAAAALIPFLEHDDANRALMGSNMQRQSVPLLVPHAPVVGTGLEEKVAKDSRAVVFSEGSGVVKSLSSDYVEILEDPTRQKPYHVKKTYRLTKFKRSNQDTCVNQRPIVRVGQRVKKGQVIADGPSTQMGELALGQNVLVGFLPWRGYNFEDAITISEKLLKEDIFSSVHIEEFELEVRDTKRGKEEITREIPNVSESALRNLDENGVLRVGAHVKSGDILVGKVTPKGETELSPEENLLRAIFGEKVCDVRDASLKAPPGMDGVVLDVKVFSRKERSKEGQKAEKKKISELKDSIIQSLERTIENRDRILEDVVDIYKKSDYQTQGSLDPELLINNFIDEDGKALSRKLARDLEFERLKEQTEEIVRILVNSSFEEATLIEQVRDITNEIRKAQNEFDKEEDKITRGDELKPGVLKLVKVYIAKKHKVAVGDKLAGRHGNKGVVSRIVPEEDMPYMDDGETIDVILNPLGVPSRMNVGQILETHLGWAADKLNINVATPVFDGAKIDEVKDTLERAELPRDGKAKLYDGKTGEILGDKVTVGYMHMMKLDHLVDDKIHARSIGPYSLVTQQPLGGKAQFGGQRFGEMEVWALEAYGAAYTLQEMLTVKSDDVAGRSRIYEAIVKGDNTPEPGLPESFNVLIKELQSLALNVELIPEEEE